MHSAFKFQQYFLKRQIIALSGRIRVYHSDGALMLYCQQKVLRLKEDIRVFSDESQSQELLRIQARQIVDFAASYDIFDSLSNERIGMVRRKGIHSIARDNWQIYDNAEKLIGVIQEDNLTRAFLRRFLLGSFLPTSYDVVFNNSLVAQFRQRFNILRYEMDLDFRKNTSQLLDPRMGIAAGLLLAIIEGKQN